MKALLNLDFAVPLQYRKLPENVESVSLLNLAETDPEMVFSAALANQPGYKADEAMVKAANRNLAAAKGALYPSLSIGGGAGTNYANSNYQQFGPPIPYAWIPPAS